MTAIIPEIGKVVCPTSLGELTEAEDSGPVPTLTITTGAPFPGDSPAVSGAPTPAES